MILVDYSVDTAAADDALLHFIANSEPTKIQAAISATPDGWAEVERQLPILRHAYLTGSSQVSAEVGAAGLVRPSWGRDDTRDSIAAPDATEAREFTALVKQSVPITSQQLVEWLQHWTSSEPAEDSPHVSLDDAAVIGARVQNIQTRDVAWAAITCADAASHVDLWRQVALLVGGRPALPVLGLLGMAAWIAGQGALANLVFDRAKRTEGSPRTPSLNCWKTFYCWVSTPSSGTTYGERSWRELPSGP